MLYTKRSCEPGAESRPLSDGVTYSRLQARWQARAPWRYGAPVSLRCGNIKIVVFGFVLGVGGWVGVEEGVRFGVLGCLVLGGEMCLG